MGKILVIKEDGAVNEVHTSSVRPVSSAQIFKLIGCKQIRETKMVAFNEKGKTDKVNMCLLVMAEPEDNSKVNLVATEILESIDPIYGDVAILSIRPDKTSLCYEIYPLNNDSAKELKERCEQV